jgi:hypothetical protein
MSTSKILARKTLWAAIDAANATLSNAAYSGITTQTITAQSDANDSVSNAALAQVDIDALELKNDIIASKAANNADAVVAQGSMPNTVKTIKVVDAAGAIIGYMPVYATATLTYYYELRTSRTR